MHLSRRLKCTIVITRCPSVVNFSLFRLLLWNHWTEFKETSQEARTQHPLPSLCFSGRSEKQDGRPGLWLAETFLTSPLKPPNGIQRNFTGSKITTSSTKFVFFGPIGKTRWPPWPLIGWDIFDFSSETTERNTMKLDRKQDLNVLYQVCVFCVNRKNKMSALGSDWLRHFRLLLWNHWTEFNETSHEARSQRLLPNFGPIGKTRWPPWPLIGWDIFDFSSETAERNSTKLDRKQDLNVFYQICVFRANWKTRWPPWPLIGWDIFDFSSETTERNSTKLDRKQDLNVLYQVCVFGPIGKTRWRPWPLIGWDIFDFSEETAEQNSNETWQEARSQCPLRSLYFSQISKQKWPTWPIPQKGGTLYSGARYVALWASCFLISFIFVAKKQNAT